jgi:hypothetical protein
VQALELAAGEAGGRVLWLHAGQAVDLNPVGNGEVEGLPGLGAAQQDVPALLTLAMVAGRNLLADTLDGLPGVVRLRPPGKAAAELAAQLARWRGEQPRYRYHRQRQAAGNESQEPLQDDDVARLWALDEVNRLAASSWAGDRERAVELAARYQIVTSVSGAVVLENAGQYQAAGLTQVDPASSPRGIPEPASWVLLLLAMVLLWGLRVGHSFRVGINSMPTLRRLRVWWASLGQGSNP